MAEQSEVEWPTCEQAGCAGIRLASARMCLAHASEEETAAALKLISETGAIDARGVPITGALLERILTAAPRGENEEPLIKGCQFGGATLTGDAGFNGATFTGYPWFDGATFTGDAWFDRATFTGGALFGGATFKRRAGFAGARFEQARQFGPLLAYRGLVLDEVQFAQPVQIEVSSTGMCCRRARFAGGVQFRLRWARVVLDDADLAAPSILAGIPRLSGEELARREEQIARAWRRLLAGEISEQPQLVSVRRANVAGLGLSNVSADDCRFAGAHNLDKLRLEPDVSFATAPSPVDPSGRRWEGREVIAEERAWRANRARWSRRRWVAPSWPGWLDDQPGRLDPGQIAGLYRALRKGREDVKDEPGAADFYYGEMEMRRLASRPVNPIGAGRIGAASRGRVERWILTAYWLVSGYGLRAWRAVAGLAVVTTLFAVAFHFVGFAVPPRPVSYWTSLLYAFRATLSLTDDQVKLTAWGQLLQGVLRLTGPVLLGLALLALRGRVKR
jgi:Pentapeptide repeats (9 copies)